MSFDREGAETLALRVLAWVAEDQERLLSFLSDSGATPDSLRNALSDPSMLAAIMDFLLGREDLARDFAIRERLTAEQLWQARAALPGGQLPHWT